MRLIASRPLIHAPDLVKRIEDMIHAADTEYWTARYVVVGESEWRALREYLLKPGWNQQSDVPPFTALHVAGIPVIREGERHDLNLVGCVLREFWS